MSVSRSRMRSRLTRASARASGAPGHVWTPWPNAMCCRAFARSTSNSSGFSKRRGSRLAAPFSTITVVPAGMSTPRERARDARQPEVTLDRALEAQRLLDEVGDAVAFVAQQLLQVRPFAEEQERGREEPHRRLLARGEQVRGDADDVDDLGRRAVREGRGGEPGQHVGARLAATVLDVRGEPLVEELQRVERSSRRRRCSRWCDRGGGRARRGTSRGLPPGRRAGRRRRASRTGPAYSRDELARAGGRRTRRSCDRRAAT